MTNSKNKIDSSSSKSKKKIINNSKKETIINKIKSTRRWLIRVFKIILTMVIASSAPLKDIELSRFLIFIIIILSAKQTAKIVLKTPTKVDSQKNIIKLSLSKFKSYVKKIVEYIKPLLSFLNFSSKVVITIFILKIVLDLFKIYYPDSSDTDNKNIINYFKSLYESDLKLSSALHSIPNVLFKDLIYNNIIQPLTPEFIVNVIQYFANKGIILLNEINTIKDYLYILFYYIIYYPAKSASSITLSAIIALASIIDSIFNYFTDIYLYDYSIGPMYNIVDKLLQLILIKSENN